jgi:hypothetical protein
MKRVFAEDVLRCRRGGGELRLVAVIQDPAVCERILTHLGLWQRGPAARASRGPRARRPRAVLRRRLSAARGTAQLAATADPCPAPAAPSVARARSVSEFTDSIV